MSKTLEEAREETFKAAVERPNGVRCPCCTRNVNRYAVRIGFPQVCCLTVLNRLGGRERWVHVTEIANEVEADGILEDTSNPLSGFGSLAHWGLIQSKPVEPGHDGATSGKWMFTKAGLRYLRGEAVPLYCYTQFNNVLGFSDETATIHDANREGFHFTKAMDRVVPDGLRL
jgi:hypothetical protein